MAFLLRFFYSCLVDADFLATEAFMQPKAAALRPDWPNDAIERISGALTAHLESEFASAATTPVNQARNFVRTACLDAAQSSPGFFSLTVPTGGGKTLSSLAFALRHAQKHGLRRIIYVIPYTSIITQTADVFRKAMTALSSELGREVVLEHHSKFDPARETEENRLAAENWDGPLIVTTNVRFFESLFANRTSACRRLHRIARSVVIFDELQALPARLLHPILRGFKSLVKDLRATTVLCTATQPALDQRKDFPIGLNADEIRPIIPDEGSLFQILRRVEPVHLGALNDEDLTSHVLEHATAGALYPHEWKSSGSRFAHHCDGVFSILEHAENDYDPATGLKPMDAMDNPNAFNPVRRRHERSGSGSARNSDRGPAPTARCHPVARRCICN